MRTCADIVRHLIWTFVWLVCSLTNKLLLHVVTHGCFRMNFDSVPHVKKKAVRRSDVVVGFYYKLSVSITVIYL